MSEFRVGVVKLQSSRVTVHGVINVDALKPLFIAGIPSEWEDFAKRHRAFLEGYSHLREAMNIAFLRTLTQSEPIERFAFGYGRLCCEDFSEVFLLCANGYGVGALKLLRTLYEHAVTLRYLHEHPEDLNDFWDYAYVAEHKLLKPVLETFGERAFEGTNIRAAEVENRFQDIKERFKVTDCKKCGTKRLNHTWNKLDFAAMAKQSGRLGTLIVPAYYVPLTHAHSTVASLASRLAPLDGGGFTFVPTAQRKEADSVLVTAHNVILQVLEVQEERFPLPGLQQKLQTCSQDFLDIWKGRNSQT
jgi:hypothetical protein